MEDGRHAVGESYFMLDDEVEQGLRFVAARINLLAAEERHQVGHAPGVDVEHRGHRHIHIVGTEPGLPVEGAEGGENAVGVQDQLTVAEVDALRQAGGAGGVEGGGNAVFVEIGEVVLLRIFLEHFLVFVVQAGRLYLVRVGQEDDLFHGGQLILDRGEHRQKLTVDQQDVVFGVIDGVEQLLARKPDIDRMEDSPEHRHGEVAFEVAVRIPVHDRHRVPGLDS
ncbi:MAG: hypothetical protein ACD_75C01779G0002 [uncultured bacterium]|nr:MAG: hypothetical protein ACD_75C01779G0002 [uncultured bacterium]